MGWGLVENIIGGAIKTGVSAVVSEGVKKIFEPDPPNITINRVSKPPATAQQIRPTSVSEDYRELSAFRGQRPSGFLAGVEPSRVGAPKRPDVLSQMLASVAQQPLITPDVRAGLMQALGTPTTVSRRNRRGLKNLLTGSA
jgi:hypothetical protein